MRGSLQLWERPGSIPGSGTSQGLTECTVSWAELLPNHPIHSRATESGATGRMLASSQPDPQLMLPCSHPHGKSNKAAFGAKAFFGAGWLPSETTLTKG